MAYLIGLIVATISLWASLEHLGQSVENFSDFVAFAVVIGGTLAVAIITFPWEFRREIARGLWHLLFGQYLNTKHLLTESMNVIEQIAAGNTNYRITRKDLSGKILRDGQELISLGLTTEEIEIILHERVANAVERCKKFANALRALAKYPPAFGLTGTVLGLVNLMNSLSEGMTPAETGVKMAIALTATFYGLLVANLFVSPAGELALKQIVAEERAAGIAVQAILLAKEGTSLLKAQELLNSYVGERETINVMGRFGTSEAA